MNTFATLLLAFPFYLAVKGKLANYISLAKPDASSSVANSQSSTGALNPLPTLSGVSTTGANTTARAAAGNNSANVANTANTVTGIFNDVAAAASLT